MNEVIYDNYQECCVINKEFKEYPNNNFDSYIDNVDIYLKAKVEREYVPPKEPTEEEKALEQIADIKDAMLVAVLTDNTALQAELKTEYSTVIADTNKKLQEVKSNGQKM